MLRSDYPESGHEGNRGTVERPQLYRHLQTAQGTGGIFQRITTKGEPLRQKRGKRFLRRGANSIGTKKESRVEIFAELSKGPQTLRDEEDGGRS